MVVNASICRFATKKKLLVVILIGKWENAPQYLYSRWPSVLSTQYKCFQMHHSKKSLNIDVWLRAVEEVYNNKNSTEDKIPRNDYTMLLCANQVRPSLKFIGERIVADEARKTISLQAIQLPTLTDVSNRVLEVHSHHLQRERHWTW